MLHCFGWNNWVSNNFSHQEVHPPLTQTSAAFPYINCHVEHAEHMTSYNSLLLLLWVGKGSSPPPPPQREEKKREAQPKKHFSPYPTERFLVAPVHKHIISINYRGAHRTPCVRPARAVRILSKTKTNVPPRNSDPAVVDE